MNKTFYTIYMLVDPRDHRPFYIGQTKYTRLRFQDHCNPAPSDKSDRAKRIREIQKAGRRPIMIILEKTTRKIPVLTKELFWIELLRSRGIKLENQESQKWLLKQYDTLMAKSRSKRRPRRPANNK